MLHLPFCYYIFHPISLSKSQLTLLLFSLYQIPMDAKLVTQHRSHVWAGKRGMHKPRSSPSILAVLARPADNLTLVKETPSLLTDNWFDRIAINHLSQSVQATTGSFYWSFHSFSGCIYLSLLFLWWKENYVQVWETARVDMRAWWRQLPWCQGTLILYSNVNLSSRLLTKPFPALYSPWQVLLLLLLARYIRFLVWIELFGACLAVILTSVSSLFSTSKRLF